MAAAWARILGQTLRDALAFDRPGRFPLRDPFSGEIAGWGGARAPLPAVDPALAAAFPGRSPRELLGALERGRGTLYDALRAYAATAPRPAAGQVLRRAPAGPGSRLGAAGLWDCRRTRPTFYACLADGERLQRSPWGRLQVNPRQQAFRPIFRALLAQGTPAPAAMREAWRQVRARNPGAAWHQAEATRARGEWHKAPLGSRRQTYFAGIRDTHDYSAEVSARRGMNPGARWHGHMATAAEVDRRQAEERGLVIGSHYYRGKREAHRESQTFARLLGMNPGAGWHDRQAVFAERIAGQEPRRRQYWEGQGDAHTYSALASRQGENPQVSFDPFDYGSPQAAKRARDARYRELRARGIPARRSVLHGQLEKYRGLGVSGRGTRDIYYLTWADPAPPGAAVEVPWPRENPWAAWHEARVAQYRRLARGARPGSRRRQELLAMARAHRESARASVRLGDEPARIPGGRRNPRQYPTLKDPSRVNRRRIAEQVARVIGELGFHRMAAEFRRKPALRARIAGAMGRQVALRLGPEKAARFVDLAMLAVPPRGQANPRGSRAGFRPETLEPKGRFDPRSFRTVASGRALVTVGCPRGKWDPRRERCKVGTRAQRILHPIAGRNPHMVIDAAGEVIASFGGHPTQSFPKAFRAFQEDPRAAEVLTSPRRLPVGARVSAFGRALMGGIPGVTKRNPAGVSRYLSRIPRGAVEIYGRVNRIFATKGRNSRFPGQRFVHRFTKPARILGLPDGRLLITPVGRR